jgi:hypothetical protein
MKRLFLLLLCLLPGIFAHTQEINCMVSVSAPKLEGSDKKVFETLQTALYEFMNNRKWTNYNVKVEERIECTILLTLNERPSPEEFKGTLNVVLRRPVYNSAYNTVLLNYIDKDLTFTYVEYQPLDYSDGTYSSNLTSILAYYTYIFLGLYWDSYTPNGGTQFFQKAQDVVNVAQSSQESGWKAYESQRNRYWLVENYLNSIASPIREFYYKYHRLGLDQMYEKVDAGRTSATQSIDLLYKMYNARPDLFALQLTLDAKKDEFVNIYSDSRVPPLEKNNVVNILKEIDPANSSKYQAILESK